MNIIVISDTHIKFDEKPEDEERRRMVLSFLNDIPASTDILVLNGDIFDLWFDWKTVVIASYTEIISALQKIQSHGTKIVLICGNHDFWFNGYLQKLGFEIYSENYSFTDNKKNIFIAHGDRYTSNDLRYIIFRACLRNKFTRFIFKFIHPEISLNIGKKMSRSSRKRIVPKKRVNNTRESLIKNATKLIENGNDVVIFGHAHNPEQIDISDGTYLNSGDWIIHNSWIEINDGKPKLSLNYKKGALNHAK